MGAYAVGEVLKGASVTKFTSVYSSNKKLRPITLTYFLRHAIIFSINFEFFQKVKYPELFSELISRNNVRKELL